MHGAIIIVLFIFTVIGHFRVPKTLTLKTRLSVKPFLWKWVFLHQKKNSNSKMAYLNLRESCVFSKLLFISIIIKFHFCKSLARWVVTSQEKALVHEILLDCIYSGLVDSTSKGYNSDRLHFPNYYLIVTLLLNIKMETPRKKHVNRTFLEHLWTLQWRHRAYMSTD